jgi:hypothetical protein
MCWLLAGRLVTTSEQQEFYRKVQALKFTQSALEFIDL